MLNKEDKIAIAEAEHITEMKNLIKIARLHRGRRIVAATGAFHGRTMGALSLTGQSSKRDAFKFVSSKIIKCILVNKIIFQK